MKLSNLGIVGYAMASSGTLGQTITIWMQYGISAVDAPFSLTPLAPRANGTWGVTAAAHGYSQSLVRFYFEEALGMGANFVVWLTHRRVLRRARHDAPGFLRACRSHYAFNLEPLNERLAAIGSGNIGPPHGPILPLQRGHRTLASFASATSVAIVLTVLLLLLFVGGTICWSVALSRHSRPTLLAIVGNGAIMTLLFLSMQPARVAKEELGRVAALVPLMSLFVVKGWRY